MDLHVNCLFNFGERFDICKSWLFSPLDYFFNDKGLKNICCIYR